MDVPELEEGVAAKQRPDEDAVGSECVPDLYQGPCEES